MGAHSNMATSEKIATWKSATSPRAKALLVGLRRNILQGLMDDGWFATRRNKDTVTKSGVVPLAAAPALTLLTPAINLGIP